jgi:hypothetical protein
MATVSFFMGIDSLGEIDSAMELISRRKIFLLYEKFLSDTPGKRKMAHVKVYCSF